MDKNKRTIVIDREVHRSLKITAARRETTVCALIKELVADHLDTYNHAPVEDEAAMG